MGITRRISIALLLLLAVTALGTVGYRTLVGGTWVDCLYMTVITISTVGYGEVVPGLDVNPGGRVFTILLILVGAGILLYVVSSLTAFFVEGELTDIIRRHKMEKKIQALQDHIIVCGTGTTGICVVEELTAIGEQFVAVERDRETLDRALEQCQFLYIHGDATIDDTLSRAGIERARGVISLLPTDPDNLFVTFTARQIRPGIRIVSRGVDLPNRQKCLRAGADTVVFPNRIGGLRMASEMVRPHVVSFLDRMLRPGPEIWRISEVTIPEGGAAAGKTLGSLRIQERVGVPVLALTREEGREVTYYPPPETVLTGDSQIVVLAESGQRSALERLVREG